MMLPLSEIVSKETLDENSVTRLGNFLKGRGYKISNQKLTKCLVTFWSSYFENGTLLGNFFGHTGLFYSNI